MNKEKVTGNTELFSLFLLPFVLAIKTSCLTKKNISGKASHTKNHASQLYYLCQQQVKNPGSCAALHLCASLRKQRSS
ncbi:hypothetical protein GDO81_001678 [Engystomops pustulosus]|uniref:Secreted protein n=1 Tax=Engystomops pustulosus TaxID=76066 RepID=A0AAV7DIE7_ENGPU|nr:hypothetical protein GDO81_001678 [Engystomops pustulosus]